MYKKTKWDLSQVCKSGLTLEKPINVMHHIDKIKKKIMSIGEEKEFGKIDLPVIYDKTSQRLL